MQYSMPRDIDFIMLTQEFNPSNMDHFIGETNKSEMPRYSTWNNSPIVENIPTYKDPPPPPPTDLTEGKRPNHLSDIPEEMWNENYKPELQLSFIEKYFNAESLHHAIILGSIVFGLKMIELNWSVIKMFCIENQNYFYLAWALFAVLHINRDIYTSQKKKQENDQIDPNKLPDRKPHLEC